MCDLIMTSARIDSRSNKDYGKDRCYPHTVYHIHYSRADRHPPKIQRGYCHPRRAGAPEETADGDGTGAGYGLRSSCGVVMLYVDDVGIVS